MDMRVACDWAVATGLEGLSESRMVAVSRKKDMNGSMKRLST